MSPPLVSVVIPAYNSEGTIADAIRSVLAQTTNDLELLVVDDGSTDATRAVASSIADPRVRVLRQPNQGAAAARNAGIRAATGRYVALLDADDLWLPEKLERQLGVLETKPEVHAVQAGAIFVDDWLRPLSVRPCSPSRDALLETLLFQNMPANMETLIIARDKFAEMGYFDPTLPILEEWDMAIKVARHCNLVSIPDPLALYRVYAGNRSADLDIHVEPGFRVLERLFDDPDLPVHIRAQGRLIWATFFTMLAGAALRTRRWRACVYWAARATFTHPRSVRYMAGILARRVRRRRSLAHLPSESIHALEEVLTVRNDR